MTPNFHGNSNFFIGGHWRLLAPLALSAHAYLEEGVYEKLVNSLL
jgi:hypothetical protein